MKTRLFYALAALFTLFSCSDESVDSSAPEISESDKTVSVIISNIPGGSVGAPVYLFTLNNKGVVYATDGATAKENAVLKIQPAVGFGSFDIVVFIPNDADRTPDKSFTSGQYSKITGVSNRKGVFVTNTWTSAGDLGGAPSTGVKATLEAILKVNGSATPSVTDFKQGDIISLDASTVDYIKSNVTSLAFRLDASELKSYTTTPYKFQFNTVNVATGSHTLYVKADNAAGHTALDSIKIFISKSNNVGPSIAFNGLANGAQIVRQTVIAINTTVSDPDDGIDKVEFKVGNLLYVDKTAPYTLNWDTYNNSVGSVTIEITAYDKAGQSRSDVINVVLTAPTNYFPRTTITSPANAATFAIGTTISLAANVSDDEGDPINRVEFYYRKSTALSDAFLGSDLTSPYAASLNTTGLTAGDYYIFAYVFNNAGNYTYTGITITLN